MLKQSPLSAVLGRVGRFVLADALLLATSWALVYQLRFGQWPAVSRGPLGLIGVWLFNLSSRQQGLPHTHTPHIVYAPL